MTEKAEIRLSRLGLAVVKLRVATQAYYLMRLNPKWKDVNFIGGHEKRRDASSLKMTAQRELWEEVPSIRSYRKIHLSELTEVVRHGPIFSKSRGDYVVYELQYFGIQISDSPNALVQDLSSRSRNVWLETSELMSQSNYKISGLVSILLESLPGGLDAIPFSFAENIQMPHEFKPRRERQLELALK